MIVYTMSIPMLLSYMDECKDKKTVPNFEELNAFDLKHPDVKL